MKPKSAIFLQRNFLDFPAGVSNFDPHMKFVSADVIIHGKFRKNKKQK